MQDFENLSVSDRQVTVDHDFLGNIVVDDTSWKQPYSKAFSHLHVCLYRKVDCHDATGSHEQGPWCRLELSQLLHEGECGYCALLRCEPTVSFGDFSHLRSHNREEWIAARIGSLSVKPAKRS